MFRDRCSRCIHVALFTFDSPMDSNPGGTLHRPASAAGSRAIIEYDCTYSFGNLLSLDKHIEGDERSMEFGRTLGIHVPRLC